MFNPDQNDCEKKEKRGSFCQGCIKMRNYVLKMRNYVLKMRNYVLKMMNFADYYYHAGSGVTQWEWPDLPKVDVVHGGSTDAAKVRARPGSWSPPQRRPDGSKRNQARKPDQSSSGKDAQVGTQVASSQCDFQGCF